MKALKNNSVKSKPKLDEKMEKRKREKNERKEKLKAKKMLLLKKMLKKKKDKKNKDKKSKGKKDKELEKMKLDEMKLDEMDLDDTDSFDIDSEDTEDSDDSLDSFSSEDTDSSDDEKEKIENPFGCDIDKQLEGKIKPIKSLDLPKKQKPNMKIISKDYVDICTQIHTLSKSLKCDKNDKRIIANVVYFYIKYFLYSCCIKKKPVFSWLEEFKDKINIY